MLRVPTEKEVIDSFDDNLKISLRKNTSLFYRIKNRKALRRSREDALYFLLSYRKQLYEDTNENTNR